MSLHVLNHSWQRPWWRSLAPFLGVGLACLLGLSGCDEEKIEEVRVPSQLSGLDAPQFRAPGGRPATPGSAMNANLTSGDRLLIAMIDRPNATYFLRIQAKSDAVESAKGDFRLILESLAFDTGVMKWRLPEGWTEKAGGAMFRIATLTSPTGVEVFVTELTPGQEVLANVNRWQGQLGLPPATQDNLPIERVQINGQEMILYDQTAGGGAEQGGTAPKPAAAGGDGAGNAGPPSPPGSAGESGGTSTATAETGVAPTASSVPSSDRPQLPFTFENLSDEWKSLPPSAVAAARWSKSTPNGELKWEIFQFPAEATFLSMLGIWVERAGLAPPSEETLPSAIEEIPVADQTAQFLRWPTSAETPATGSALLIARVVVGTEAWYFKVEGPAAEVQAFEPEFLERMSNAKQKP